MSCPYQKDGSGNPSAPAQICTAVEELTGQNVRGEWHGTDSEIDETLQRWRKWGVPYTAELGECNACGAHSDAIPVRTSSDGQTLYAVDCDQCPTTSMVLADAITTVPSRFFPGRDDRNLGRYSHPIEAAAAATQMFESLGVDPASPTARDVINRIKTGNLVVTRASAANMGRMAQAVKRREQRTQQPTPIVRKAPATMERDSDAFTQFAATYLNTDRPMDWTKAMEMAVLLHEGQTDQSGDRYINHPLAVSELTTRTPEYAALTPEQQYDARVAAVLHDTVEDTAITLDDLRAAGANDGVIAAIDAVTTRKDPATGQGEPKADYYQRIKDAGPVAVAVKLGDLSHNNMPERRATLPGSPTNPVKDGEEDRYTRLGKKYWVAYTALGSDVPEHLEQFAPK